MMTCGIYKITNIINGKGNNYESRKELCILLNISQPTCAKRIKLGIYNYVKK